MNTALSIENPIILNTPIKRDNEGRYCLNDLHKASGGHKKHRPAYWLDTQQAQALIEELTVAGIPATEQNQPLKVMQGGTVQGTFAAKELAIAYATWIDAKFFLVVIRTFDAVATGINASGFVPISDYLALEDDYLAATDQISSLTQEVLNLYRGNRAIKDVVEAEVPRKLSVEVIESMARHGVPRDEIARLSGRTRGCLRVHLHHARKAGRLQ